MKSLFARELKALTEQEEVVLQMQKLLELERPFARDTYPAHFTASALIFDPEEKKILLTLHRKLKLYLQLGGHIEEKETPLMAAHREGLEESGLSAIHLATALPFDIDIHPIPASAKERAHLHYDVCYLFTACSKKKLTISEESLDLKWFCLGEHKSFEPRLQRFVKKISQFNIS